ncbi:ABC transporter permease, partial [Chloroflexota bacterium]
LSGMMGLLGPGIDFTKFIFPGIIGMSVLMSSLMSGVSLVWDREFGFLKEVLVAPISRISVVIGKTLGAATIALIQGSLILLFAPLIGITFSVQTILIVLPLMFLLASSLGSFGILLATRIRSMEAFQAVMQMLMFPMVFLSGVFFPLQDLPSWMSVLVKINPASYGIAAIRQVILGSSSESLYAIELFGRTLSLWDNVAIMLVLATIVILLAMWSFSNQE